MHMPSWPSCAWGRDKPCCPAAFVGAHVSCAWVQELRRADTLRADRLSMPEALTGRQQRRRPPTSRAGASCWQAAFVIVVGRAIVRSA